MVTVTVTAAQELTKEQLTKLATAVEKKRGEKVSVNVVVDPSVIGGVKVQIGSAEYDATIDGKLAHLRQELMQSLG